MKSSWNNEVTRSCPRTLRSQASGFDTMLNHQPKLTHRLAPPPRPLAHQRRIIEPLCAPFRLGPESAGAQPASNAALQARSVQDTDDGKERLVEPLSLSLLILSLLLPPRVLLAALAFLSLSRMGRGRSLLLRAIWCSSSFEGGWWWWWYALGVMGRETETERGEVGVTLCSGVFAHAEVVVGLERRLGVRVVQQDRRGGRVGVRGGLGLLLGGVAGGCD